MFAADPIQSCPKKLTAWPMGCAVGGRLSIGTTQSWSTRRDPFALQRCGPVAIALSVPKSRWSSPATTRVPDTWFLIYQPPFRAPRSDGPANECDPEDAPLWLIFWLHALQIQSGEAVSSSLFVLVISRDVTTPRSSGMHLSRDFSVVTVLEYRYCTASPRSRSRDFHARLSARARG